MKQIYENYNAEDFEVWQILFDRQMQQYPTHASQAFIDGIDLAGFRDGRIPDFNTTNSILKETTGWQLAVVPGIVPDFTFFELMANRRFPATTWLRKKSELDYLEEPDMFHDVFAHVPLLTNQHFVDFLEELSRIGLSYIGNDYAIELLSRVYWFTVEFGLIQQTNGVRIYGAGILSSAGETEYSLGNTAPIYPFTVTQTLETPYRKDQYQKEYFVIESYEQLYNSVQDIKDLLKEKVSKETV
ncbi:MAG: phenylalanine 4-monooxygenase [Bacteroidota bacterium]